MKYIKIFETRKKTYFYKVGDYVIMRNNIDGYSSDFLEFISNNIGRIIEIDLDARKVRVKFEESFDEYFMNMNGLTSTQFDYLTPHQKATIHNFALSNVAEFSANREDIEAIIMSKKYNL